MLVLTRHVGERIMIGDDVTITVVALGYGKVRIGVDAPRDVVVSREELLSKDRRPGAVPGANHDHQQKGEPTRSEST